LNENLLGSVQIEIAIAIEIDTPWDLEPGRRCIRPTQIGRERWNGSRMGCSRFRYR